MLKQATASTSHSYTQGYGVSSHLISLLLTSLVYPGCGAAGRGAGGSEACAAAAARDHRSAFHQTQLGAKEDDVLHAVHLPAAYQVSTK